MIKISLTGLAKFMTSGPAAQRKVVHDYRYPDEDEPKAMRLYYLEAVDSIKAYHLNKHPAAWLNEQAERIGDLAATVGGMTRSRLNNNARAVRQYAENFGARNFTILNDLKLALVFGSVRVTVIPDLHVREANKEKIVKLGFARTQPDGQLVKIVSQSMFEAYRTAEGAITSSNVLYLDVARGIEHRGARVGARLMTDIKAACENIEALWDTIPK
jgi:predicted RNA-binding protein with EMAP domain